MGNKYSVKYNPDKYRYAEELINATEGIGAEGSEREYNRNLIKSKDRVAEHGEVYIPRWCVKDMMDLEGIKESSFDLDKTFLEPACGNGNFLVQILARKLAVADQTDLYRDILRAVATTYGVDILEDNVKESRERLFELILARASDPDLHFALTPDMEKSIKYVLCRNIILGNMLTYEKIKEEINAGIDTSGMSAKEKKIAEREAKKNSVIDTRFGEDELSVSEWEFNLTSVTRKEYYMRDIDNVAFEYSPRSIYEVYKIKDGEAAGTQISIDI